MNSCESGSEKKAVSPQERFWRTLYELVYEGYLLEAHSQRLAAIDRLINAFVAITSTTSLGIWAVFKSYPTVWATIIVATQIVSAVSKHLPFTKRLQASAGCAHEYREIQNWAEAKWCEILDGDFTDAQINKARLDLHSKTAKAEKAHFPLGGLPGSERFREHATSQAQQYLLMHYG